jgi:N-acetylglucosaminyl-diphospho-decaprenol L-rhamnosyltransferase
MAMCGSVGRAYIAAMLNSDQGTTIGALTGRPSAADLAVITVSTNEAHWLRRALPSIFEHAGDAKLDVVVVDNSSTDGTREMVESEFPEARVITSDNHGFGHANNCGAITCDAPYVLFLNPDTEILEGTFGQLLAAMEREPDVGLAGVIQLAGDGTTIRTIRYFPSVTRSIGEAFGSESWPVRARWARERELDMTCYTTELDCDWTSGSFMLARREALLAAGLLDERFFLQCEEPDLCLRIKRAGWSVRHLPIMTIVHHAGKAGRDPRMAAQDAYARRQYAHKHFSAAHRALYLTAIGTRHAFRGVMPGLAQDTARARRIAARRALRTLIDPAEPPFCQPPQTALWLGPPAGPRRKGA